MTPNELVLTYRGSYVRANFGENRSRNATVRVPTDGQTHTDTHTDTQAQTDFIICPMLYAIAMGQIKIDGYPFLRHPVESISITCAIFLFRRVKPLVFFAYLVNFVHTLLKHYSGYFYRLTVNSQPDGAAEIIQLKSCHIALFSGPVLIIVH